LLKDLQIVKGRTEDECRETKRRVWRESEERASKGKSLDDLLRPEDPQRERERERETERERGQERERERGKVKGEREFRSYLAHCSGLHGERGGDGGTLFVDGSNKRPEFEMSDPRGAKDISQSIVVFVQVACDQHRERMDEQVGREGKRKGCLTCVLW
jgi:hypothetical protein